MTSAADPYVLDEYRMDSEYPVIPVEVSQDDFLQALQYVFEGGDSIDTSHLLDELPLATMAEQLAEQPDLLESDDDAPIIQLVNSIIVQAVRDRASDIHIEPFQNEIVVRFRVDGVLHEILCPPKPVQLPLMSRVKLMADLNIAEKRLPQDGSMQVKIARKEIDVRVSSLPTSHGERLVLRLLDKESHLQNLSDLGFSTIQREWIRERLNLSHGILLVTGPTGSGKSTTLYAGLSEINGAEKNTITIEDPIEFSLEGVGQIQVNQKIGLTFASGLRSVLRQDPDVIMVGEIRDAETAEIAIQASLTGHLVLSTLHTNDSIGAIIRLMDIGIEPFLVGSSLEGIIAQRLVRCLCDHCKEEYQPADSLLGEFIGEDMVEVTREIIMQGNFFRPIGCDRCMHTGYRGRTALFEMFGMDNEIREVISQGGSEQELLRLARGNGMRSLREDGLLKAATGVTSLEEVFRVTQGSVTTITKSGNAQTA